ncbi:hypothetical protein bcgnr5402_55330 [Bacillus cereus]
MGVILSWGIANVIVPLLLFLYLRNELKEDTSERVRNRVNFVMGFGIFSLIIQILSSLMYAFLILFSLEGTLYRFVEKCVNVSMYCIWATFFIMPVVFYFTRDDNEENSQT